MSPIKIPNYIFRNGLRTVAPYYVKVERFARSTWVQKSLITALLQAYDLKPFVQLQMNNQEEIDYENIDSSIIKKYLTERKVFVRRKSLFSRNKVDIIDPETLNNLILNHSDYLSVLVHKHEIPVSDGVQETELKEEQNDEKFDIPVLFQDENLVVVNKPSGIPTHPTGRNYGFNSVTEIVKGQLGLDRIFNFNRLDRLTSGILIFSKNTETNQEFQRQQTENEIKKSYLARVDGNFKDKDNTTCNDLLFRLGVTGFPQENLSLKEIMKKDLSSPQLAQTQFKFISYNSEKNQSLVICKPITGRTHQIRIHLRNLGHPISNDKIYGQRASKLKNSIEMNPETMKKILNHKELMKIISSNSAHAKSKAFDTMFEILANEIKVFSFDDYLEINREIEKKRKVSLTGQTCSECGTPLFADPIREDMMLYLHAFEYKNINNKWCFTASFPAWAKFDN